MPRRETLLISANSVVENFDASRRASQTTQHANRRRRLVASINQYSWLAGWHRHGGWWHLSSQPVWDTCDLCGTLRDSVQISGGNRAPLFAFSYYASIYVLSLSGTWRLPRQARPYTCLPEGLPHGCRLLALTFRGHYNSKLFRICNPQWSFILSHWV